MRRTLKKLIERTPISPVLSALRQRREIKDWERSGRPAPPPHAVKQRTLREFSERFGLKVLVETGTYYGDMVDAMKHHFNRIYSVELSKELHQKAKTRFAGYDWIQIIHGDSGIELGKIVPMLDQPALFWLDGHYSAGVTARGDKDTPIYEELAHIFNSALSGHVVIIDDARCFGTETDYPTIEELTKFIKSNNHNTEVEVKDDSIRIYPPRHSG